MPELSSLAYRAQQFSLLVPSAIVQRVVRMAAGVRMDQPGLDQMLRLRRRYEDLLREDLQNARDGLYPRKLLFSMPVSTYAWQLPQLFADFPRSIWRRRRAEWRDIPDGIDKGSYPAYFRRTF